MAGVGFVPHARPRMPVNNTRSLAEQTARGSFYTLAASGVTITLGFVRSVLLARFLLPDHFGTVALAMVFVILGNRLRSLGLHNALLHKQSDRGPFYTTFFTLQTSLVVTSAILYAAAAPLVARFYPDRASLAPVMTALIGVTAIGAMNQIQETLLRMHLKFDRLALVNVASSVAMFAVAPYLAWRGWGVWSLVAQEASGILIRALLLWGPWRVGAIAFGWDAEAARWMIRFGLANWVALNTNYVLERFDDFWVGTVVGNTALGFYNRAYEFARYPRRLVATSMVTVMTPVFARLQHDRNRLSKAYFRVMSLLVRVGLAMGGLILLLTPEFIYYLLGSKWIPMTVTLQLMALYMVLDPLVMISNNLLYAVGRPEMVARVRLGQLAFFVPAVIVGARVWGINGVALAADMMLLMGLGALHRHTRKVAVYSLARMVGWPIVAAGLATIITGSTLGWHTIAAPQSGMIVLGKTLIFGGVFTFILLAGEGRELIDMSRVLYGVLRREEHAAWDE